jgi:TonB-dependent SusC/RagA subfamily outer membrane receptor
MRLRAMLGAATLVAITGCSYATATETAEYGNPLARVQDSLATRTSVDLGYLRQPRGTITGAVSTFSIADGARRMHVRTLAELLQGRIAGLVVEATRSGGVSMRVRGGGGEYGGAPLVVVDGDPLPAGVPLASQLASINPADVVRVDVLKDVSATAIYGTRGSGGVVLITLRHSAH